MQPRCDRAHYPPSNTWRKPYTTGAVRGRARSRNGRGVFDGWPPTQECASPVVIHNQTGKSDSRMRAESVRGAPACGVEKW
eukprot:UN19237